MKSRTTERFRVCYDKLPEHVQKRTGKAYQLFLNDSNHPGLRLKKVLKDPVIYSARITQDYRALGVKEDNTMIWFWIGSHSDYEELLKQL